MSRKKQGQWRGNVIVPIGDGTALIKIESPKYGQEIARIDEIDIEMCRQHTWRLHASHLRTRDVFYIQTNINRRPYYLHTLLIQPTLGLQVDHIDGDPRNNTRTNLRIVTNQQNSFNFTKAKGYGWHKGAQKWTANIMVDGKAIYLGLFVEEVAARAAYIAAKKIHHKVLPCTLVERSVQRLNAAPDIDSAELIKG